MPDLIETSTQGMGSRLFGSIKGVLFGLVLVVAAFPVLWTNEGCAVRTAKGLAEGRGKVVSIDSSGVVPANEGKLVHFTGNTTTAGTSDAAFRVTARDAVRLHRKVEMYQWDEQTTETKEKNVGGSETTRKETTYVKEWSETPHDSGSFKLKQKDGAPLVNPPMHHRSQGFNAADVRVGAFALNPELVQQIDGRVPVAVDAAMLAGLPGELKGRARAAGASVYVGSDPSFPAIGDMRITFEKTPVGQVSVIGRQWGPNIAPYTTSQKTTLNMLETGAHTPAQMFTSAENANTLRTWIIRFLGFLCMFIGFTTIFKPLAVVADVVPFVGSLVSAGTGFVAFALAAPLSFVVIAAAWIVYRPVLGILLAVGALGVFVGLFVIARKKKKG
jgi:hypothetical protein